MAPLVLATPHALEDFVGRELATTGWFVLTQERISQFAEATEDHQWIHEDARRATEQSPYGATIAHGFLTLSLLSHFLREALQISSGVRMSINYGLDRVRFPAPVRSGAKIRARIALRSAKEISGAEEAVFHVAVECQGQAKPCCVAEWIVRYYS